MTSTESALQIIGHRGVRSLAPENTLGGIRKAADLGVRWVELDTTLLADGTPVVNHDASIDRCSDGSGLLASLTVADLAGVNNAARFPDWPAEPVPLLREVLALLEERGMGLNLELKDYGQEPHRVAERVLAELHGHYPDRSRLIVSSFSIELLQACRGLDRDLPLGLLYEALPVEWLYQAQAINAYSVHCQWEHLSYHQARLIRLAGYRLYCWTANQPEMVRSLAAWGVNGLITDNPQDFLAETLPQ